MPRSSGPCACQVCRFHYKTNVLILPGAGVSGSYRRASLRKPIWGTRRADGEVWRRLCGYGAHALRRLRHASRPCRFSGRIWSPALAIAFGVPLGAKAGMLCYASRASRPSRASGQEERLPIRFASASHGKGCLLGEGACMEKAQSPRYELVGAPWLKNKLAGPPGRRTA